MKRAILISTLVAFAVVVGACKQESTEVIERREAKVVFQGAGVSLLVSNDWMQVGSGNSSGPAPAGICLPTLAGNAGLIQVLLLPQERSDLQAAVTALLASLDSNPDAIKSSFRQERITVQSGAEVVYATYGMRSDRNPDGAVSRNHSYIVRNKAGRAVAINYIATARSESEAAHQMIRQTLRVE